MRPIFPGSSVRMSKLDPNGRRQATLGRPLFVDGLIYKVVPPFYPTSFPRSLSGWFIVPYFQ